MENTDRVQLVQRTSEAYLPDMTRFLRDLIAIPSESCEEGGVIRRTIEDGTARL